MKRSVLAWTLLLLLGTLFLLNVVHVRAAGDAEDDDDDEPAGSTDTGADSGAAKTEDDEKDPTKEDDKTAEDIEEEEDVQVKPSPDIVTTVYFPEHPDKKFPIGNEVTVLLGIHNKGKSPYNISHIGAYLHSPFDLDYYIQNFTAHGVEAVVEPGVEQTFDYTFRPDQRLEPLEFWLSAYVEYNNSDNRRFQTVFYNSTVELVEKPSDMNIRRVFTYFLAFAAAGLVGYIAFHVSSPKSTSTERGTRDEGGNSGWEAAPFKQSAQSRVVRPKRHKETTPKAKGAAKGTAASPKAAASS